MTREHRENLTKLAKQFSNKAKDSLRRVRSNAVNQVKKSKEGVSEDTIRLIEKQVIQMKPDLKLLVHVYIYAKHSYKYMFKVCATNNIHLSLCVYLQVQQMADSYVADIDKQLATKTKELLGWPKQGRRLFVFRLKQKLSSPNKERTLNDGSDGSTSAPSGVCVFLSCVNKC